MLVEHQMTIFLTAMLVYVFFSKPVVSNKKADFFLNIILSIISVVCGVYLIINFQEILFIRAGVPNMQDILMGTLETVLVLEAIRRTAGKVLMFLVLFIIAYAFWGNYIPGILGHKGYGISRVIAQNYLSGQGIFGLPIEVLVEYVILFIVFGNVLEVFGGAQFLIDLAKSLMGRFTGGLAQVAVLASSLMGTISGAAVANVATTGCITIPAMKKGGYAPWYAGAVEAAASTGGQIMPPIMGAAAFLMAGFLGIPYISVVKAALVPAILFFSCIFVSNYLYAKRYGLKVESSENLPSLSTVLKKKGYFLLPIFTIIGLLIGGYSPTMAGLMGLVFSTLIGFLLSLLVVKISFKETILKMSNAFEGTAKSLANLAPISAGAGILVGVVSLTGLGPRLSGVLGDISGGSLFVLLLISAIVSIIMGMGMPTTAVYIVIVTLVAPTISSLGVEPLMAHLFVLYYGILSMVTPPVALASYAAAAISGGDVNRVGITAFKILIPAYIIPFVFVYCPDLALQGTVYSLIIPLITTIMGIICLASSVQGFFIEQINLTYRLMMGTAGISFILGDRITDILAISILIIIVFLQRKKKLRDRQLAWESGK